MGRFVKGQSGNPAGRKPGERARATLAAEALLDGEVHKLTRKAVDMALSGDATAMRLCLERIIPARRDRPITFQVGKIASLQDALDAMGRVVEAMGRGDITPLEATAVMSVAEGYRRTFETTELERRLAELEKQT